MLTDQPVTDAEAVEILEHVNKYIFSLAWRKIPRYMIHPEELDLEVDELAQQTRIKLWQALQKAHIASPMAYTGVIVFTESANMQRRYRPKHPLPNEDDGSLLITGMLAN